MKMSKIAAIVTYIVAMVFTAVVVWIKPELLDVPNTFLTGMFYSNFILIMCIGLGILGRP